VLDEDLVDDHIGIGLPPALRFNDVPARDPYPESVDDSNTSILGSDNSSAGK
jgi:hypothetical protein